jgi:hypothetical protein
VFHNGFFLQTLVINYQTCGEGNCIEKIWKEVSQIKHADDITLKYANITWSRRFCLYLIEALMWREVFQHRREF